MKKKIFRIMSLVLIMAMLTVGFAGCKDKNDSKSVDSKEDIKKTLCDFCGETEVCESYKDDVLGKMNLCEDCQETMEEMAEAPEGYFQYILKKSSNESAEQIAKGYGLALESLNNSSEDMSSDAELSLTVGQSIRDMLEDETDINFDWMEKISLLVNSDITKDVYNVDLGVAFNEERLISLVVLANMSDEMAYLQIPELNETYLGMDFEMLLAEADVDMSDISEMTDVYKKLFESLPSEEEIEELLKRYCNLAISCIEDVEKSEEEVQVGELTDEFTVLEATIDEGTVKAVLEVIVAELKKDEVVKDIICDVTQTLCEVLELQDEWDADEVYGDFSEALEEFEDELATLEEEDFELALKLYVDNKGQIAGWALEEEDVKISSLTVMEGSQFAYEFEGTADGVTFILDGTGELTSTKLSGDFKVKMAGLKVLNFTLKDVMLKEMEEGYFNGTVSVSLGSGLVSAIEEELYDIPFELEDWVLELKGKSSENKSDMTLSLYENDDLLAALTLANEIGKAENIVSPDNTKVAMIDDEESLEEWANNCDIDGFVERMEGVFGEDLIALFDEMMSEDTYDDDYYYEDDYWYEDDDYYYEDDYWYEDDDYYYEDDYWYEDDDYYYEDDYWYEDDDYYYEDDYWYEDDEYYEDDSLYGDDWI